VPRISKKAENLVLFRKKILYSEDETNIRLMGPDAKISDDRLVWVKTRKLDDETVHTYIILYDLTSGQQRTLAEAIRPETLGFVDIDGSRVTWTKGSVAGGKGRIDIYLYDLDRDELKQVTTNGRSGQATIEGDYMAWREGFQDEGHVVIYNLATDKRYRLTSRGYLVRLGDGLVVWSNSDGKERIYDIYTNTVDILVNSHAKYGFLSNIAGRKALLALRPESDKMEKNWSVEIRTYNK